MARSASRAWLLRRSWHSNAMARAAAAIIEGHDPGPTVAGMLLCAARGRVHLAAGRPAEALAELEAARRSSHNRGQLNGFYLFPWGGYTALAAAAAGEHDRARE